MVTRSGFHGYQVWFPWLLGLISMVTKSGFHDYSVWLIPGLNTAYMVLPIATKISLTFMAVFADVSI